MEYSALYSFSDKKLLSVGCAEYVTIKASSTEYEDLGYFFAQIKLENVLNNAKIVKVENGETTTVEIGGDLP